MQGGIIFAETTFQFFSCAVTLTESDFLKIKSGLQPNSMQERWAATFSDHTLNLYRAWTGNLIYKLHFSREQDTPSICGISHRPNCNPGDALDVLFVTLLGMEPPPRTKIESLEARTLYFWENGMLTNSSRLDLLNHSVADFYSELLADYSMCNPRIPLLPYIDENYLEDTAIRVMHIGLNAYASRGSLEEESQLNSASQAPNWWRHNATSEKPWDIHQSMQKSQMALSHLLIGQYRCNAIKIWLDSDIGKSEEQLTPELTEAAAATTAKELLFLQNSQLTPSVIFCYGNFAWHSVWPHFYQHFPNHTNDLEQHRAFRVKLPSNDIFVFKLTHHAAYRTKKEDTVDAATVLSRFSSSLPASWQKDPCLVTQDPH